MSFCYVSYRAPIDPVTGKKEGKDEFVAVPLETERPMIITAEKPLLYAIASVNPEAATLLLTLVLRSRIPEAIPPEKGDGGAPAKITLRGASEAISAFGGSVPEQSQLSESYADPNHSTRWNWELTRLPRGAATLLLRHSVVNQSDELVAKPYADIELSVQWNQTGKGGYWSIASWSPVR